MPYNASKASEYGKQSVLPEAGAIVQPASAAVTGSTLSEASESDKTGSGAAVGVNAASGELSRVRADAGGQAMTTIRASLSRTITVCSRWACAVPRC